MIDESILRNYEVAERHFPKNEILFSKGQIPRFYYQLITGEVKMSSYNDAGKEFIQGIFSNGRSFGEPPLIGNFNYPANAITLTDCTLFVLSKEQFIQLLLDNPEVHLEFTRVLANRLYYKAIMSSGNSNEKSDERILTLIDYLKFQIYKIPEETRFEIDLTRQQIADLTGLRVETVIRSLKKLAIKKEIIIAKRKIYR